MLPILFSIGRFHVYSFSIFLVLSWLVFSFLFWRALRSDGVDEDKIFDLTFYGSLVALVCARVWFVVLHWALFSDTWLKIVTIWVQPGLSLYGAFIGGLLTLIYASRQHKVRVGHVLDAFALSFPGALIVGLVGAFLDGSIVGKVTNLPWALRVVGQVGKRHPTALYDIVVLLVLIVILAYLEKRSVKEKWPYGVVGVWFFVFFSVTQFTLEFASESHVYWVSLSANQWILVALFAEALGAFYVRGGGRERIRPLVYKIQTAITRKVGGIYAKFSKRRSE